MRNGLPQLLRASCRVRKYCRPTSCQPQTRQNPQTLLPFPRDESERGEREQRRERTVRTSTWGRTRAGARLESRMSKHSSRVLHHLGLNWYATSSLRCAVCSSTPASKPDSVSNDAIDASADSRFTCPSTHASAAPTPHRPRRDATRDWMHRRGMTERRCRGSKGVGMEGGEPGQRSRR
eukprot:2539587-Rhodomonas_salina.1